ncbi:PH domain-containing protein [Viridibacillus sp. YIM B01967]|uniref:PH domain-containing protein n=2 Tax=Viridibacillus soli TaxID=2798301 RepID=A0ABS1H521_9BACL|nr:PH domain-containing protein [Viridibacillus soli]
MSDEKFRLHPISAIINCVKGLKDLLIPFFIIFVGKGFKFNFDPHDEGFFWDSLPILIAGVLLVLNFVSGVVKWRRFVYWFEDDELRIEYGLFVKKKRYIPFERIQSLNYQEGILHRPLQLVKVSVETAASKDKKAEAELTAITRTAADMIELEMKRAKRGKQQVKQGLAQNELLHEIDHDNKSEIDGDSASVSSQQEFRIQEDEIVQREVIHRMSVKDLLILATTSGGVGVVFSGLVAIASQFGDIIPYDYLYDEIRVFVKVGVLLVMLAVFLVLFVAWGVSFVLTLFNYYSFIVERENDKLIITRGLLEKRRVTIPLNRIQGIKIVENPLRQMFGYATVTVESAGGSMQNGEKKIILMPLVKKRDAIAALQRLFPEINWLPTLTRSPKRARPSYYKIGLLWILPVTAVVSYLFFPYGLLSLLIIPLLILLGVWQHKTAGYALDGYQLTVVYRTISRTSFFMEKKRLQQMTMRQTYFKKRIGIASLRTTIMSGSMGASATIAHFEKTDIEKLMAWYEPNAKSAYDVEKSISEP